MVDKSAMNAANTDESQNLSSVCWQMGKSLVALGNGVSMTFVCATTSNRDNGNAKPITTNLPRFIWNKYFLVRSTMNDSYFYSSFNCIGEKMCRQKNDNNLCWEKRKKIDDSTKEKQLCSRIPYQFFPSLFRRCCRASCIYRVRYVSIVDVRWIYTLHIGWCVYSADSICYYYFCRRHIDTPSSSSLWIVRIDRYEKFHLSMTNFK